jgi:hypothetical protein
MRSDAVSARPRSPQAPCRPGAFFNRAAHGPHKPRTHPCRPPCARPSPRPQALSAALLDRAICFSARTEMAYSVVLHPGNHRKLVNGSPVDRLVPLTLEEEPSPIGGQQPPGRAPSALIARPMPEACGACGGHRAEWLTTWRPSGSSRRHLPPARIAVLAFTHQRQHEVVRGIDPC